MKAEEVLKDLGIPVNSENKELFQKEYDKELEHRKREKIKNYLKETTILEK